MRVGVSFMDDAHEELAAVLRAFEARTALGKLIAVRELVDVIRWRWGPR